MAINKTPVDWSANPSAETNLYAYDSATDTYDSTTQNYDGVVDANLNDTTKLPTTWSNI